MCARFIFISKGSCTLSLPPASILPEKASVWICCQAFNPPRALMFLSTTCSALSLPTVSVTGVFFASLSFLPSVFFASLSFFKSLVCFAVSFLVASFTTAFLVSSAFFAAAFLASSAFFAAAFLASSVVSDLPEFSTSSALLISAGFRIFAVSGLVVSAGVSAAAAENETRQSAKK